MSKYYPLYEYLKNKRQVKITLRRKNIEKILGWDLPPSSRLKQWWANDPFGGHSQSFAWVDAGFIVTSVDEEAVVFMRVKKN